MPVRQENRSKQVVIVLGVGRFTAAHPRFIHGGPTVAKYDQSLHKGGHTLECQPCMCSRSLLNPHVPYDFIYVYIGNLAPDR